MRTSRGTRKRRFPCPGDGRVSLLPPRPPHGFCAAACATRKPLRSVAHRSTLCGRSLCGRRRGAARGVAPLRRLVPVLHRWTRWERDEPWRALRRTVFLSTDRPASGPLPHPGAACVLRPSTGARWCHVRLAQVLDFVGRRAEAEGRPGARASTRSRGRSFPPAY